MAARCYPTAAGCSSLRSGASTSAHRCPLPPAPLRPRQRPSPPRRQQRSAGLPPVAPPLAAYTTAAALPGAAGAAVAAEAPPGGAAGQPGGQQGLQQQLQQLQAAQQQAAQQQAPSPVFCERETLTGLLRQFVTGQESFDSGLQIDGVLSYYRRLGCSPQQIQAAVMELQPTARPTIATGAAVEPLLMGPTGLPQQLQLAAWELTAAAVAAAALTAYQARPRGWSRGDLLEVRESFISGRGVFTRATIPPGTVLGSYPGRLRSGADMLEKCRGAPLAASYAFRTADGHFLDPTDASGQPSPYPKPGWPWPLPTDVALSYVNEPPKGSLGTNATVEDGPQPGELLFVACTEIPQGAEVLIDYGITYDRSGYGKKAK